MDGDKAHTEQIEGGFRVYAGTTPASDADHCVLWTKREFKGDIKIDFNFKRLDSLNRFVNIIYIQAQGSGKDGYDKDITKWNDKRKVPSMSTYFNNMNTIHLSYAAYENDPILKNPDYIRGRRYMPEQAKGLNGTALNTEYLSPMLFEHFVCYRITILKNSENVMMRVVDSRTGVHRYFSFSTDNFPPINSGRIGLRQMSARNSEYSDVTITTK